MSNDSIQTVAYGGGGGDPFPRRSFTEIGLRGGDSLDAITLDDATFGGGGGQPADPSSITLSRDEYISEWLIRHGDQIDNARFATNKGRVIGIGGGGGTSSHVMSARLLAIGGRSGGVVDHLDIMYIDGYQPSTTIDSNANFILSFLPPFNDLVTYADSKAKEVYAYSQVTTHMVDQQYSASVEGEYYVKVKASTNLNIKDTDTNSISSELTSEQDKSESKKQTIPDGHVGYSVASATIMQGADGSYWMYPNGPAELSVVTMTDFASLVLGCYDLTGVLDRQIAGLGTYKSFQNGFTYYKTK